MSILINRYFTQHNGFIWLLWDNSEFKDVYYPGNSIGINRRGCGGCSGLEKIVGELKAGKFYYF